MGQVKRLIMEMQEKGNFPSDELKDKNVCSCHFDDPYLKKLIEDHGTTGTCSYCEKKGNVRNMYEFSKDIAWKINLYFIDPSEADLMLAKNIYEDEEEEIPGLKTIGDFVIPKECTVYDSTKEMMFYLNLYSDNDDLNKDIEGIFTSDTWIEKDIYGEDKHVFLSNQWDKFVYFVTHQRRFTFLATPKYFKAVTDSHSSDILTQLRNIIIEQGLCKNLPIKTTLFRARKVEDPTGIYKFKDITAPPDIKAFPNRMSPAGISMFYASFNKETAMNECVGDDTKTIIIGKFNTIKELRVIDFSDIPDNSFWMDGWQENLFLHKFNSEITKRTDPNDKNHLQYIPTQIFTEYLRYMFKDEKGKEVDGLIYGSSKTKEKNIVIFCDQKNSSNYVDINVSIEVYISKYIWEKKK